MPLRHFAFCNLQFSFCTVTAVLAAAILPYLSSLKNGFVWEDEVVVIKNAALLGFHNFWTILTSGQMAQRPVANISLAFDARLFGMEPFGYHLENLLLHALASVLVYRLAWTIFRQEWVALPTGLLFALHPVHSESVNLILDRSGLLCAVFYLLGFLFHLGARNASGWKGVACQGGLLLSFASSVLSKEMGITLPWTLLAYEWLVHRKPKDRRWKAPLPALFLGVLFLGVGLLLLQYRPLGGNLTVTGLGRAAMTIVILLAEHIRLLVLPLHLSAWYEITIPHTPFDRAALKAATIVAAALVGVGLVSRRVPHIAFAAAWVPLTLVPVWNLVPIPGSILAERWLYIPSIGFCLAVALVINQAYQKGAGRGRRTEGSGRKAEGRGQKAESRAQSSEGREVVRPSLAYVLCPLSSLLLILALYAWRIVDRNPVWKDTESMLRATLRDLPDSAFLRAGLAGTYVEQGKLDLAEREYRNALSRNPHYPQALKGLGSVLLRRGDLAGALDALSRALKADPRDWQTHNALGLVHLERGEMDQAVASFRQVLEAHPNSSEAHNGLGEVRFRQGRIDEAIGEYRLAIRLDRWAAPSYWNLALALEEKGQLQEALAHWRRFLELSRDDHDRNTVLEHLRAIEIKR